MAVGAGILPVQITCGRRVSFVAPEEASVHVTVMLYATLRQYGKSKRAGAPSEIDLSEDATVQDLINQLKIRPEETRIIFVNGIIQEHDWKLKEGDVVGMFPPIGE